ncbi:hypothetical protein N431DRAFT_563060 [Stipitochalara longipes BDJ]|nr:hypothetical protein N431DRAFT_563060 [Stipitochalara longipes BDJ]
MSYTQHSLEFLGPMKLRSSPIAHGIDVLRTELEERMSKERREQMRLFVMELKDNRQRRAAEVYLARYPGFVLDGEGKLDYGVGDRFAVVKNNQGAGACILLEKVDSKGVVLRVLTSHVTIEMETLWPVARR